jgi:predicted PurR-regulated permease PerM
VNGRRALAWLAGGAVVAIVWLAWPFATGLLLGTLMGFTCQPLYLRLAAWSGRSFLASVASRTASLLLGIFFALLAMHVMQHHWPRIVSTLEKVSPLPGQYTRALLEEFRRVGRIALSGTVATGLVQGLLAGVGFWITGVPKPVFLGIATAIASLVPVFGTPLVWVPAGLYLFAIGHPTMAGILLLWGALLVVGFSDYVIRPRLVGEEGMPPILTFLSLFGGLETMGLAGLIAGPVIMALAVSVLRLYAREARVPEGARRKVGS